MKEKNYKHKSHHKRDDTGQSNHHLSKHTNILKEKDYRKVSNVNEKVTKLPKIKSCIKDHRKKDSDRSSSKKKDSRHKSKKVHETTLEESYEELSRKKRKIECELRALDLEEAARKKQKSEREKPKHKEVKIKEEPVSDDSDTRTSKARGQSTNSAAENNKHASINSSTDNGAWGHSKKEARTTEKEKPNFAVSGKLAEDTNIYNGVVIKYNEPAEARKPKKRWRLYPFKGDSDLPFLPIHRQSAYLFGRTRSIADIPIDHPSCSKQHAVLQFRLIPYKREDGTTGRRVRPYIIDLESSNGTFVNNKRIDPRCYVELIEKDVVKFGYSSREYVLLHEESKNDNDDEDVRDSN